MMVPNAGKLFLFFGRLFTGRLAQLRILIPFAVGSELIVFLTIFGFDSALSGECLSLARPLAEFLVRECFEEKRMRKPVGLQRFLTLQTKYSLSSSFIKKSSVHWTLEDFLIKRQREFLTHQNQRMQSIHFVVVVLKSGIVFNRFAQPPQVLFGWGWVGILGELRKLTEGEDSDFVRFWLDCSSSCCSSWTRRSVFLR